MASVFFTGQSFFYWFGTIVAHEAIRQPTLYIILWAILKPIQMNNYRMMSICLLAITGSWLGIITGSILSYIYSLSKWAAYSISLFIGDIINHLTDQYMMLKIKKDSSFKQQWLNEPIPLSKPQLPVAILRKLL